MACFGYTPETYPFAIFVWSWSNRRRPVSRDDDPIISAIPCNHFLIRRAKIGSFSIWNGGMLFIG